MQLTNPTWYYETIGKDTKTVLMEEVWTGTGHSLVVWPLVCRPKNKGGLGFLNLSVQNDALLIKHLQKFYNKEDVPWVQLIWNSYYFGRVPHDTTLCGSFWWRDVSKLMDKFRVVYVVQVNSGDTVLFWRDNWALDNNSLLLQDRFKRLFSYCLDKNISVQQVLNAENLLSLFQLPLSEQAYVELQCLSHCLD